MAAITVHNQCCSDINSCLGSSALIIHLKRVHKAAITVHSQCCSATDSCLLSSALVIHIMERVNTKYDVLGILPVPISKNSVTALTLVD